MALSIPTRVLGGPDPAADINLIVPEINRLGGIVDGAVTTFLNAVDVVTDARALGVKDVAAAPTVSPVSAVKLYSEAGVLKYRNPSSDVIVLDGPAAVPRAADQGLIAWAYDPVNAATTAQLTSGTIYLIRMPVRRATTVGTLWFSVGTAASGVTAGQTFAGLVGPTGTVMASAGASTAIGTTGTRSVAITPQPVSQGNYWVALLFVATTMPFLSVSGSTPPGTPLNANLAAASYRFAVNGTAQTALPGTVTLASNTEATARGIWAAVS